MAFARVVAAQPHFPESTVVNIETDLSRGLYSFSMVGLPGKAVEEARDRIASAIKHSGFSSPKTKNHKVIISLAPADVKKEGPVFDVGMALSYLLASEEVLCDTSEKMFAGELALDGTIRKIKGALAIAKCAEKNGYREVYVPKENAEEAALVSGVRVFGVSSLIEVVRHLTGIEKIPHTEHTTPEARVASSTIDFKDIAGQETTKRGMEIAAAGHHNVSLMGPPGTGKTMLASALSGILSPLSKEEIAEVTAIHSIAGVLKGPYIATPPFRAPHHTSSFVSLVGGGAIIRPGEITLAHRGVLFLDEFPEFDRRAIEALREPLENRSITVSRASGVAHYPANMMLVVAMNPPGDRSDYREIVRFKKKLSGAIIDRIDMWIEVPLVPHHKLSEAGGEDSEAVRARVIRARERARARGVAYNSTLPARDIEKVVNIEKDALTLLQHSASKLKLSPRSYHKTLRLARTIADLEGSEVVKTTHIFESLQYRPKMAQYDY